MFRSISKLSSQIKKFLVDFDLKNQQKILTDVFDIKFHQNERETPRISSWNLKSKTYCIWWHCL